MTALSPTRLALAGAAIALVAGAGGFGLSQLLSSKPVPTAAATAGRKVLYWYDPMQPGQHFDKPGKSPFMDMQLVPRYADEGAGASTGVQIDPRAVQNLGVRLATVERGDFSQTLDVTGALDF